MIHHIIPSILLLGLGAALYIIGRMHGRQAAEDAAAEQAASGSIDITPQGGGGARPVNR